MDDLSPRRTGRAPILVLSALLGVVVLVSALLSTRLWFDDQQAHRVEAADQTRVSLEGRQVGALQKEVGALRTQAANPTVEIWNTCGGGPCRVGPNAVLLGGVPDTFVIHFAYTSPAPVALSFLTFHQWTEFDTCGFEFSCITSAYVGYPATTKQSVDFTLGAGCAGYLYVLTATTATTVQPNVSGTYRPASTVTGECAAGT